ncbi:MAG: ribose transport system permease protein [Verrucomicrobiota bacterium]|nr:ribose transport system permease protein [Verrucomicrobiota bacterium]
MKTNWENFGSGLKRNMKMLFTSYLLIVLILTVILGCLASPYFLTLRNVENVLTFAAVVSVIAVGQFFVVVTGGIDLSVGSIAALTTVVAAVMMKAGHSAFASSLTALVAAGAVGGASGFLVIKAGITPFIATLAMMSIARGLSYLVQVGSLIGITNKGFIWFFSGSVGPLPNPVSLFVLITLVAAFFMRSTTFGRRLYAIGGNTEAARLSGLPVKQSIFSVYVLSGLLSGFGGLILAAQLTQGSSLLAQGYELDTIAAVVVGGAALTGGTGNPVGAVVGGLIIAILGNIMNLMTIPSEPQLVVKGILIIIAVVFIGKKRDRILRKKQNNNNIPAELTPAA